MSKGLHNCLTTVKEVLQVMQFQSWAGRSELITQTSGYYLVIHSFIYSMSHFLKMLRNHNQIKIDVYDQNSFLTIHVFLAYIQVLNR